MLAAVAVTILRRPAAWRPWVLLVVTCLAFSGLVGLTRAARLFGPADAGDVRYVAFDAFFLSICLGLVLMPVRKDAWSRYWVAVRPPPSGTDSYRHSPRRSPPPTASGVLVVGYSGIGGRRFRLRRCTRLRSEPRPHRPGDSRRPSILRDIQEILAGGDVKVSLIPSSGTQR